MSRQTGSVWSRIKSYFRNRPWLGMWIGIFAAILLVLGLTGNLHTQGNGLPTMYEIGFVSIVIAVWVIAKVFFKTDLTEEYLLGLIFGIQWEFLTEPYWTYLPDRFNILAWKGKDIPLLALGGWGTTMTMALLMSNWFGKRMLGLSGLKLMFDWRVLVCDAIAIQIMGTLAEWTCGILLKCWTYNMGFGMGISPFGLGWEIHIGYMIVMFWYATTMRVWKYKLEKKIK